MRELNVAYCGDYILVQIGHCETTICLEGLTDFKQHSSVYVEFDLKQIAVDLISAREPGLDVEEMRYIRIELERIYEGIDKHMTNYENIQGMTIDEMAEFIARGIFHFNDEFCQMVIPAWKEWLNEEVS